MPSVFVANFIRFPAVQRIWKWVKIWQIYRKFKGRTFLRHSVYTVDKEKSYQSV